MEEDYEPTVQHQRRVNPKIHDVIKKEVEKLLDAGLIYPISDSPWGGECYAKTDAVDLLLQENFGCVIRGQKRSRGIWAADLLSRLRNPHQINSRTRKSRETFLSKLFGSVALRNDHFPCLPYFANTVPGNSMVTRELSSQ
ncbi:hypothetical protein Tco_0867055 [Tanacetum coccineum]